MSTCENYHLSHESASHEMNRSDLSVESRGFPATARLLALNIVMPVRE